MACGTAYLIKAVLLVCLLLILLNLLKYTFQSNITLTPISVEHKSFSQQSTSSTIDETAYSTTNTQPQFVQEVMTSLGLNNCPSIPPDLVGPIDVNKTVENIEIIESHLVSKLSLGGLYKPKECNATDRVAIIIPYRNRPQHLPIFFANIHPFLMKQQIEYGIFLIEQVAQGTFNKAALMNAGYIESQKFGDWDCFIFHDLDLLPMDDRNLYKCPVDQPRHMSVAVDTFDFKLIYEGLFGGVTAMTKKQFQAVNGFSNLFLGWGGEDDDMHNRLSNAGYHIERYPIDIAKYTMLSHEKEHPNPDRLKYLENGMERCKVDGLNSLEYKIHYLEKKILYTWLLAEIKEDNVTLQSKPSA